MRRAPDAVSLRVRRDAVRGGRVVLAAGVVERSAHGAEDDDLARLARHVAGGGDSNQTPGLGRGEADSGGVLVGVEKVDVAVLGEIRVENDPV